MQNTFELVIRNLSRDNRFINCGIKNAISILQTDVYMRGIDIPITIPVFWDIVQRNNSLDPKLQNLLVDREIVINKLR